MTNGDEKHTELVDAAIANYAISVKKAEFIRHNENITYRLYADEGEFILRIHKPREGFSLGVLDTELSPHGLFINETEMLRHIAAVSDLTVQTPLETVNGGFVCDVSGYPACLLSRIDGVPLSKDTVSVNAARLGCLAAELDGALSGFHGERYIYSHSLVNKVGNEMRGAEREGHILSEELDVCLYSLERVDNVMSRLDVEQGGLCLIHSDMGPGNIIQTATGLAAIDFSLSGYGYRAMECGMLASVLSSDNDIESMRLAYIEKSGIHIGRYDTDAFLAMSVMIFIACQHTRYYSEEWFAKNMKRWTSGCVNSDNWLNK